MWKLLQGKLSIAVDLSTGISGLGAQISSEMTFTVSTIDYYRLYDLFELDYNDTWQNWSKYFKNENDHLFNVFFEKNLIVDVSYKLEYNLQGSEMQNFNMKPLKIYCDVLRFQKNENFKNVYILNLKSIYAGYNIKTRHPGFTPKSLIRLK